MSRGVDAESALDMRPEQFEHAAGPGAEIEQRAERTVGERGQKSRFHGLVGDMQPADAVPLGGVTAEVVLRGVAARRAHGGEPLAVARERAVGGVEPRDERTASSAASLLARRGGRKPKSPRETARPAGPRASSLRWREMRGCDWRRISVRSETVSSLSASSASTRRRVSSAAALSAV